MMTHEGNEHKKLSCLYKCLNFLSKIFPYFSVPVAIVCLLIWDVTGITAFRNIFNGILVVLTVGALIFLIKIKAFFDDLPDE